MQSRRDVVKQCLWGCLSALMLTYGAQASTLTKLRVVESGNSAQVILSVSQPASYHVKSHLEENLVRLHLERTSVNLASPQTRLSGPLLQDITISEDTAAPDAGEPNSHVTVEVRFSTAHVSIRHEPLTQPPGVMLIVRGVPPTSKAGDLVPGSAQVRLVSKQESPMAGAPLSPTAIDAMSPHTASLASKIEVDGGNIDARDEAIQVTRADAPSVEAAPHSVATPEVTPQPTTPTMSSRAIEVEVKDLIGHESSAAASLALLELYFHRPTIFAMNPSLLWSIAGAYADLGLYEESQAVYRRIATEAESPALRAVAGLKQGQLALQQGEWGTAESLLRQFITIRPRGLFLAEAHEALGDTLLEQGRFTAAVEAYTVALAHTPEAQKPPQLFQKLGRAQSKAGHWPQAAEAFRQVVEHSPTSAASSPGAEGVQAPFTLEANAFQQLGDSLYQAQQYEGAVGAYRRALERTPGYHSRGWVLYHTGKSYEQLRKPNEASQAYQELVHQADPFWSEVGQQALTAMRWRQP
jgi:tetratricopeptide (TPR) repeat protein